MASRSILNHRRENRHAEAVAGLLGRVALAGSCAGGAKQPSNRAAAVQDGARTSGLDGEDRESTTSGCEIHLMTSEEHQDLDRQRRRAGKRIIEEQARSQVRTFLDELKNGTTNYRTVASLGDQVAQEYRGRAVLELLQNAHDVLGRAGGDDRRQVSFVLNSSPEQPELLIANSGRPFLHADFSGICQLAQSPKDPNKSVGNKGLGFRSVLELTTRPEVWSMAPAGGDTAFTFGFDPGVGDPIARIAQALVGGGPATDPAFGQEPVVDWSDKQIEEYRGRLSRNGIKPVEEVTRYLSPYVLPRFLGDPPPQVARLLEDGHVTVIRLPLDGGKTGDPEGAIKSVRKQLALDAAAMVFLHHLSVLRISIDGKCVEFMRRVDSGLPFRKSRRRDRVRVSRAGPDASDATERSFHAWSRTVGDDAQPEEAKTITAAVRHLPNRWPEVRMVEVAVAVEEAREAQPGALVIFLPTEMETGVGAHVNAPFYGSLDRKYIYFGEPYNELLIELVTDLLLDAAIELVNDSPEPKRGRMVIDLLARAARSRADDLDPPLADRLRQRAQYHGRPLDQLALILCDDGWRLPRDARTMPTIPDDDPIGRSEWRRQAGFTVASSALDERREAVEDFLRSLAGSPDPKEGEWADTLAGMAGWVGDSQTEPAWNDFLRSAFAILPQELLSEPAEPDADPLRTARFLPTSDGRLLAASDDVQVFFRPRDGADDAAGFVDSIPNSLKERIAFLHSGVKTLHGTQQRNTEVQKFLDGRFVRSFRREDLLRNVVIKALSELPEWPVAHGSTEATACAEILSWTLKLIGGEEQEGLSPTLSRLPVACHDGWFAMEEAVFGPGWDGRCGNHLKTLADSLPGDGLLRCALLSPDDPRWGAGIEPGHPETETADAPGLGDLFARAGVVDGLRLEVCDSIRFWMSGADRTLPDEAPVGIPQSAWDDWKQAVRGQVKPRHSGWFEYDLRDVTVLAPLHRSDLGDSARTALSNLILTSLPHWEEGWDQVTIRKVGGEPFSQRITSPLKHWLSTLPWLQDGSDEAHTPQQEPRPLRQRWLVPTSLLRDQKDRFRHLAPLDKLAQRLGRDEALLYALAKLGLNVYPTEEDDRTGPVLLDALAGVVQGLADGVEAHDVMPAGGFDVLLGQVRHAWRHFDPNRELPKRFVVRTRPHKFEVRTAANVGDAYLPDHAARTRSLREHHQPIFAMWPTEARGEIGDLLHEQGARQASELEEHCLVDGRPAADLAEASQAIEARLDWLPVVLLSLAAYGGNNPRGPQTGTWLKAKERLQRARVLLCNSIEVELLDANGESVARSEPDAYWMPQDDTLLLNRDVAASGLYERVAPAAQAILGRQDLLKDLRLVLGSLAGQHQPTRARVEKALGRAEIDEFAVADIQDKWGGIRVLRDRIRPVVALLGVSDSGLGDLPKLAALTAWLSEAMPSTDGNPRWPSENLVAAAREARNDFYMGYSAGRVLGDEACLPKWNEVLKGLGRVTVRNVYAGDQARRYLDQAARSLRTFARHVARAAHNTSGDGDHASRDREAAFFSEVTAVHEGVETTADWRGRCAEWSDRWWEVPFDAVLTALRARYQTIPRVDGRHLEAFEDVTTMDSFNAALAKQGVDLEIDPLDIALDNWHRLRAIVRPARRGANDYSLWELCQAWSLHHAQATGEADSTPIGEAPDVPMAAYMYLGRLSEDDLFDRAMCVIDNPEFRDACVGCQTTEKVGAELKLPNELLKRVRKAIQRRRDETNRGERTFTVADVDYEIGGHETYGDLFRRLKELPEPIGPRAENDVFSPLRDPSPSVQAEARAGSETSPADGSDGSGTLQVDEAPPTRSKTAHLYSSPHLPELVGIVGEMHAFRFLKSKFNIDKYAWVSEFRTKVLPLGDGEKDETSDSYGYDFRFTYDDKDPQIDGDKRARRWYVEVKATTEDGTSFDISAGQLAVARRVAASNDERWRILRVRRALSKQPECDWLPNPFESDAGQRLRLRQGSMTVEYALSKNSEDERSVASTQQCEPEDQ